MIGVGTSDHVQWMKHRSDDGLRCLAESWAIDLPKANNDLQFAMGISLCSRVIQPSLLRFSDRQSQMSQFSSCLQLLMECANTFPEHDAEEPRRAETRQRAQACSEHLRYTHHQKGSRFMFFNVVPQSNIERHDARPKLGSFTMHAPTAHWD